MALRRRRERLGESIVEHDPCRGKRACGKQSAACGLKGHHGLLACVPPPFASLSAVATGGDHDRVSAATAGPTLSGSIARPSPAAACPPLLALRAPAFSRRARAGRRWYWAHAADRKTDSCRLRPRDLPWRSR